MFDHICFVCACLAKNVRLHIGQVASQNELHILLAHPLHCQRWLLDPLSCINDAIPQVSIHMIDSLGYPEGLF